MHDDEKTAGRSRAGQMDRRTLLGKGATLMGGALGAMALKPPAARAAPTFFSRRRQWDGNLNMVVGGEVMALRRFSNYREPPFMRVIDLCRQADVTHAHMEGNFGYLHEMTWAGAGNWGGSFFINDPMIAQDLKWAGIDMLSLAQNHSKDWGEAGVLACVKHVREAGLAGAGIGSDLDEARYPSFFECAKGRIANVSLSSGNRPHEWAGLPKGSIPGRPGVNPLRIELRYTVPTDAANQLRQIRRDLGFNIGSNREFNITPQTQSGGSGFSFVEGDTYDVTSFCDERDVEGNLRAIDFAKSMADFVIVSHHNNQNDRGRGDHPDQFVVEFAKKAIERGADLYVGHGWHRANAIEMHQGKPIIYGTGNFWAQNEFVERVPYDSFETHGYSKEETVVAHPASPNLHPGQGGGDGTWWTAPLYQFTLKDGAVREIRLHPMEFGWDVSGAEPRQIRAIGSGKQPTGSRHAFSEGRPFMASGANAEAILARLQRVYKEYGTDVRIENGIGVISL